MKLQDSIIDIITKTMGKDEFFNQLKRLEESATGEEKNLYSSFFMYFSLLFQIEIDVESDYLKYKKERIKLRSYIARRIAFDDNKCKNKSCVLKTLIYIIDKNHNQMLGIRKLAV